jgi:uncharacterized delta-60 repeat protein
MRFSPFAILSAIKPRDPRPPGQLQWSLNTNTGATTNRVIWSEIDNWCYCTNTESGFNKSNSTIYKVSRNGNRDTSYQPQTALNEYYGFWGIGQQTDGKIVAGVDGYYNYGTPQYALLRFNTNGSLDTSFTSPYTSSTNIPTDIQILSDDSIVYRKGGKIWKLPANGGSSPSGGTINTGVINMTSSGKILIAGYKLNTDLSINTTYSGYTSYNGGVELSNGDIVWFGGCTMVKTNSAGVVNTGFTVNILSDNCATGIQDVYVQSDDKLVVGGRYFSVNSREIGSIIRLNSDGSNDTTWDIPSGANQGFFGSSWLQSKTVSSVAADQLGNLYVTGDYFKYDTINSRVLTQLALN